MKEENLIFIISQPRAGSTYLQSLLADGEVISSTSEPWLLFPFSLFNQKLHTNDYYNYDWFKTAFEEFIDKKGGKDYFTNEMASFLKNIYFKNNEKADYFLDKTPRYYEILDFIVTVFPKAKIIILKRNPEDVLKSIIKTWKVGSLKKLGDYSRDLLEAPKLMQKFLNKNKNNANVLEIKYEELLIQKKIEIQKICDFIELKFNNSFLESNPSVIRGSFGDPNILDLKHQRSNHTSFSAQQIKKLVNGYLAFLNIIFLKEYGYIKEKDSKLSFIFIKYLWKMNYRVPYFYNLLFKIFYYKK